MHTSPLSHASLRSAPDPLSGQSIPEESASLGQFVIQDVIQIRNLTSFNNVPITSDVRQYIDSIKDGAVSTANVFIRFVLDILQSVLDIPTVSFTKLAMKTAIDKLFRFLPSDPRDTTKVSGSAASFDTVKVDAASSITEKSSRNHSPTRHNSNSRADTVPASRFCCLPLRSKVKNRVEPEDLDPQLDVEPPRRAAHAMWLTQGVTGSDASLPIFDGSSLNPRDHLIELEDDSMETEPDVRVYFHLIGLYLQGDLDQKALEAVEEREIWDAQLVRSGRGFLQSARAKGYGYYVDSERLSTIDLAAKACAGSRFYLMPAIAVAEDLLRGKIQPKRSEGYLCPENIEDNLGAHVNYKYMDPNILTNVRIPLWWKDCLLNGVVPGTLGFDQPIILSYDQSHPVIQLMMCVKDFFNIRSLVSSPDYHPDQRWYDADKCAQVLNNNWPEPDDDTDDSSDGEREIPDYLAMQGLTARSFLGLPPLTKKEQKQRDKANKQKAKAEEKRVKQEAKKNKKG